MDDVEATTCASPDPAEAWDEINWHQCRNRVRRLQARIVKAVQEGRWGKVKALQHLLTHSFSAKALAVGRVTENKGKNTSGVDKVLWSTKKSRFEAISTLKQRGYKPKPLRRIYIPKPGSNKMRPLSIPTMKDRAMQTLYKYALEPIAETSGDPNSYGFREARSAHDAIGQCFIVLSQGTSAQWVLEGDIKGAFDNVSHEWIKESIPMNREILMKFQKSGYAESGKLFPTDQGTAQGSALSPTIFNMVLDGMERELDQLARAIERRERTNPKIHLCRYADDFIVTGYSKEVLVTEVKPLIEDFLRKRGLQLSEEKTIVSHIDDGFDFLGWNVRKYKGKLLIKPAKKRTIAFLNRVRDIIKANKATEQGELIHKLNPMLRGWAQYHKRICAKQVYKWVDNQIWKCLWQWAKRRHADKNKKWIREKYFHSIGKRNWVFSVKDRPKMRNPEMQYTQLYATAYTKIQRHVKVKSEVNPFDANWRGYLEARKKQKYDKEEETTYLTA